MYFRQLLNDDTACASYLLGCKSQGKLAVVDAHVDLVDEYIALAEGQGITVKWRGNPVFVRHRTQKEIDEARSVPMDDLADPLARNENLPEDAPASDENRSAKDKPQYIVMMGVCTHLGCVPLGEAGDYHGWFCPCHGSTFDMAGRVFKNKPAPDNLEVPPHKYLSDAKILIGEDGKA